jgi:hypothetical protein
MSFPRRRESRTIGLRVPASVVLTDKAGANMQHSHPLWCRWQVACWIASQAEAPSRRPRGSRLIPAPFHLVAEIVSSLEARIVSSPLQLKQRIKMVVGCHLYIGARTWGE